MGIFISLRRLTRVKTRVLPRQPGRDGDTMRTIVRSDERILQSDVFDREDGAPRRPDWGHYDEPGRRIPIYHRGQVLVVGGGPSGTAAAAAAAKAGADVCLIERYNHLGGLSTGGLVI